MVVGVVSRFIVKITFLFPVVLVPLTVGVNVPDSGNRFEIVRVLLFPGITMVGEKLIFAPGGEFKSDNVTGFEKPRI